MIEKVQCIVVTAQGFLGLMKVEKGFAMVSTPVEFDETPHEAAHRVLRATLGRAARFENIVQLNAMGDDDGIMEYTFMLRVIQSATGITMGKGFQWIAPNYREMAERLFPGMFLAGVASTYRLALQTMAKPAPFKGGR